MSAIPECKMLVWGAIEIQDVCILKLGVVAIGAGDHQCNGTVGGKYSVANHRLLLRYPPQQVYGSVVSEKLFEGGSSQQVWIFSKMLIVIRCNEIFQRCADTIGCCFFPCNE